MKKSSQNSNGTVINTWGLRPSSCPRCKFILGAVSGVSDTAPDIGQITVCGECGNFLQFEENDQLKNASLESIKQIRDKETRGRILFISNKITEMYLSKNGRKIFKVEDFLKGKYE